MNIAIILKTAIISFYMMSNLDKEISISLNGSVKRIIYSFIEGHLIQEIRMKNFIVKTVHRK